MFDNNPLPVCAEETVVNTTAFNASPHVLCQSNMDYFGPFSDWSPIEGDGGQFSQSFTSSPTQLHEPIISNQESVASSSDGTIPSLLRKGSFPGQEDKRKAQNRNSQRAFRRRQASYITSLESELQELRTKYKDLLRFFSQIKQTVDLMGQEIWEKGTECKASVAAPSMQEVADWTI